MMITQTISGVAKDGLTIGKPRKVNNHSSQRITIKGADGKSKAVISVVFEETKPAKKTAKRKPSRRET